MSRKIRVAISLLVVVLLLAACASPAAPAPAPQPAPTPPAADGGTPAAETPPAPARTGTTFVSMGGAVSGTTGMLAASTLAGHVNRVISDINMTAEASGGSIENIRRLNDGDLEFGIIFSADIYEAWTGTGDQFEGEPLQNFRVLGNAYLNYLHFILLEDSGIRRMEDLAGRRIGTGAMGTGSSFISHRMFTHLGMLDDINVQHIGGLDSLTAMRDGQLDGSINAPSVPWGALLDLTSARNVVFIEDMNDVLRAAGFFEEFPFLLDSYIPAGYYDFVDGPIPTIAVATTIGVYAGVPDDVVYDIMRAIWDPVHLDTLKDTLAPLAGLGDEELTLNGISIPLHPGAEQYWISRGFALPTTMQPG